MRSVVLPRFVNTYYCVWERVSAPFSSVPRNTAGREGVDDRLDEAVQNSNTCECTKRRYPLWPSGNCMHAWSHCQVTPSHGKVDQLCIVHGKYTLHLVHLTLQSPLWIIITCQSKAAISICSVLFLFTNTYVLRICAGPSRLPWLCTKVPVWPSCTVHAFQGRSAEATWNCWSSTWVSAGVWPSWSSW